MLNTYANRSEMKMYCRNFAFHAQADSKAYNGLLARSAQRTHVQCDCIGSWDRIRKVTNTNAYSTSTSLSGRTCRRWSEIVLCLALGSQFSNMIRILPSDLKIQTIRAV